MAAIFGKGKIFFKLPRVHCFRYPLGLKFQRNCSISHGSGDSSKFVFCHFWQKFENSKWPPFLGRGKFFENYQEYIAQIPCGSKILTKSLYLARLRKQKQICVLPFLAKIKNGCHFWEEENFLKIAKGTLLR